MATPYDEEIIKKAKKYAEICANLRKNQGCEL